MIKISYFCMKTGLLDIKDFDKARLNYDKSYKKRQAESSKEEYEGVARYGSIDEILDDKLATLHDRLSEEHTYDLEKQKYVKNLFSMNDYYMKSHIYYIQYFRN